MKIERQTITVEEAGIILGVSKPIAYRLVKEGKMPALKLGPHKFVVPIIALQRILENAGNNKE